MASQSNTGNSPIVTALFRDGESAECAYRAISSRGYDKDEVNVMMSDETRQKNYPEGSSAADTELGNKALEGSGTGGAIGGTVGAIIGAIAAIGTSIALPGFGLLIAGPIAGALVGAGAGGITGGLIGALIGSGIPEETAQEYETGIKSGGTVLGVTPRSSEDAAFFEREWTNCGGVNVYSSGNYATQATAATATSQNFASPAAETQNINRTANQGETVIPVTDEQLQVGKREVEQGGVRVHTHIEERPVEETVNLREEHVRVERRPVNRPVGEGDIAAFEEGTIEVMERTEQPVVSKQARVIEEVNIGKEVSERQETVRDTVRRTEVDVDDIGTDETRRTR
jgi:uncharacterized protein (TIGR02271 family)